MVKPNHKSNNEEAYIENSYIRFSLENGIVHGSFTRKTFWDYEKAREIVRMREQLCNGKTYPLLLDIRHMDSINKEAREFMASEESMHYLTACALLVDSPIGRFLGNLFLKINRPRLPLKIFENKVEAIAWLEKQKLR